MNSAAFRESDLVERILAVTSSPDSVPFYRRVIRQIGDGAAEEELGELRYRMRIGQVREPAKYFTRLLLNRVCAPGNVAKKSDLGSGTNTAAPRAVGSELQSFRQLNTYASSSANELLRELRPLSSSGNVPSEQTSMQLPYSRKFLPWATFLGPEFFTISTNPARSDRVVARLRGLDGALTEVPMIRGRLFPKDEERGILTTEDGRILGALECLWVEQGCHYVRFGNGSVSCFCNVPIRQLALLLGWASFGGRDLVHLKRKVINIKATGFYLELETIEAPQGEGLKGFGFSLIDIDLVEKTHDGLEQTIFRVRFSDPYSRQLLLRRVVSRSKEILTIRSELAFLLRLYLEPILISRGAGREHSIELLNLIRVLNLPAAGWHRFKSRRKALFGRAVHELQAVKTADSRAISANIQQGLNQKDFMLVAKLVPSGPDFSTGVDKR